MHRSDNLQPEHVETHLPLPQRATSGLQRTSAVFTKQLGQAGPRVTAVLFPNRAHTYKARYSLRILGPGFPSEAAQEGVPHGPWSGQGLHLSPRSQLGPSEQHVRDWGGEGSWKPSLYAVLPFQVFLSLWTPRLLDNTVPSPTGHSPGCFQASR